MWLMLQQDNSNDYLICSGNVISLREITEIVFKKLELDFDKYVEIEDSLMRNVELDIIYGDNSKAKNELGWNYDISSNQLIEKLINDEKEFLEWKKK